MNVAACISDEVIRFNQGWIGLEIFNIQEGIQNDSCNIYAMLFMWVVIFPHSVVLRTEYLGESTEEVTSIMLTSDPRRNRNYVNVGVCARCILVADYRVR